MKQSENHNGKIDLRKFAKDDNVYVENFARRNPRWIPGKIVKITGPLSYEIQLQNGALVKRHVDHVRKREVQPLPEQTANTDVSDVLVGPMSPEADPPVDSSPPEVIPPVDLPCRPSIVVPTSDNRPSQPVRRSNRNRPPPVRYRDGGT